jgi:hypothetical protein
MGGSRKVFFVYGVQIKDSCPCDSIKLKKTIQTQHIKKYHTTDDKNNSYLVFGILLDNGLECGKYECAAKELPDLTITKEIKETLEQFLKDNQNIKWYYDNEDPQWDKEYKEEFAKYVVEEDILENKKIYNLFNGYVEPKIYYVLASDD